MLETPQLSDVLNASACVVALIALIISVYSWRTADRAGRNDVLAQVRDWGGEVVDALSDAAGLCALDPRKMADGDFFLRRSVLMCRFSSLLDRGRFFFPNTYRTEHGTDKPPAFRGIRPAILDVLALSFELTKRINYLDSSENGRLRIAFVRVKRAFVSAVQDATSFSAPPTVKRYELYLKAVDVEPLPAEIRELANARSRDFVLTFNDERLMPDEHDVPRATPQETSIRSS